MGEKRNCLQKENKKETPSSLHHYTSLESVAALFEHPSFQEKEKKLYFTFRASNAFCMNDKKEGKLFAEKFFTDSVIKKDFQKEIVDIAKEKGEMYCVSFCKSDKMTCHSGNIPMWSMYGANGKGAILVFNYKKMKDFLISNKIRLCACDYMKTNELKKCIKEKNKEVRGLNSEKLHKALLDLHEEFFTIKDWHWWYENEWRILERNPEPKFAINRNAILSYVEIYIPINCLSNIILGPLVDTSIKKWLNKRILDLKEEDESIEDIKVKQSKLQMR